MAAKKGLVKIVRVLLAAGIERDKRNGYGGRTSFIEITVRGHNEVVQVLLDAGADIERVEAFNGMDMCKTERCEEAEIDLPYWIK